MLCYLLSGCNVCVLCMCLCLFMTHLFPVKQIAGRILCFAYIVFLSSFLCSVPVSLCFWKSTWNLASSCSLVIPIKPHSICLNLWLISKLRRWSFSEQVCYTLGVLRNNWFLGKPLQPEHIALLRVDQGVLSCAHLEWKQENVSVVLPVMGQTASVRKPLCLDPEGGRWQQGSQAQVPFFWGDKDFRAVGLSSWIGNGPSLLQKDQQ